MLDSSPAREISRESLTSALKDSYHPAIGIESNSTAKLTRALEDPNHTIIRVDFDEIVITNDFGGGVGAD